MKKLLPLIASSIFAAFLILALQAHAVSWTYYRSLTVTSTPSIASGTNANFPMLVSSTYADWASSANGGVIQNLTTDGHGNNEAADLVFATSTANCTAGAYLNFETESYSSTTGALVDWVNVPTMQTGTVIYVCYDASSVMTDQSHPSSTWNSNYVGVWHMYNASDSTANAFTLTPAGGLTFGTATSTFGKATKFVAASSQSAAATIAASYFPTFQGTMDVWVVVNSTSSAQGAWDISNGDSDFYNFGGSIYDGTFHAFRNGPLAPKVPQTTWAQVVVTDNSSTNQWAFYQNAQLVATSTGAWHFDGTRATTFGTNTTGVSLNGVISETRLASTSLSSQWILTEYNNENSPDDAQSSTTGFYHVGAETAFGGGSVVTQFFNWIEGFGW